LNHYFEYVPLID